MCVTEREIETERESLCVRETDREGAPSTRDPPHPLCTPHENAHAAVSTPQLYQHPSCLRSCFNTSPVSTPQLFPHQPLSCFREAGHRAAPRAPSTRDPPRPLCTPHESVYAAVCVGVCSIKGEFFIDNLLVRIHFCIVMMRWTGLAPWEFESSFPGSITSTFL